MQTSSHSEVGTITRLVLKHARDAFVSQEAIADEWQALGFTAAPDFERAIDEYEQFAAALRAGGADVQMLPRAGGVGLDSIYVRDAAVVCDRGVILCGMGKPQRLGEPAAQEAARPMAPRTSARGSDRSRDARGRVRRRCVASGPRRPAE